MLPLAEATNYVETVLPVYSLDGMTLLLGVFFLFCLANPSRVKNQTQFWAVFVCLLAIILLHALRLMAYNWPFAQVATGVFIAGCQAAGLVLTVLYVGGLQPGELADELKAAAEDFRQRGRVDKPVIVPLTGEVVRPKSSTPPAGPPRVVIDLPKGDAASSNEQIPLA